MFERINAMYKENVNQSKRYFVKDSKAFGGSEQGNRMWNPIQCNTRNARGACHTLELSPLSRKENKNLPCGSEGESTH